MKPDLLSSFTQPKYHRLILAVAVFMVYLNAVPNGYNMDDNLVTQHHALTSKGISGIGKIFTSSYYSGADLSFGYRPVTHLTFAIEHQLFGEHAAVSHFINLLLFLAAVLLFYQLINQWVGPDAYVIAFLAALIFAVHPVHTEAVASIKNRDELLAFVFMLLAARYLDIFIGRERWLSWVLALLFFSLGMLSKKSIYPMVFVLPVIQVFVKRQAFRAVFIASLSCILPAAIIGSDFVMSRAVFLFIAPLAAIAVLYALKHYKEIMQKSKVVLDSGYTYFAGAGISWAIIVFAFLDSQPGYLLLTIPFVLFTVYRGTQLQVLFAILQLAVSDFLFPYSLGIAALIAVIGYSWHACSKKELSYKHITISTAVILSYLLRDLSVGTVALLFNVLVFFFLLNKKPLWALAFIAAATLVSFLLFEPQPYLAALLVIAAAHYFFGDKRSVIEGLSFLLVTASLFYVSLQSGSLSQLWHIHFVPNEVMASGTISNMSTSGLSEGRLLHYIENSLVAPHTKAETIGTGFLTLGEYLRLMIFPAELSFYYGYARTETVTLSNPFVWLSIVMNLGLVVLALLQLNKRPLLSAAIAWYLLCILLFSNWVELVAGMVGERLLFTASAGFCLFMAVAIIWVKPAFDLRKPKVIEYAFLVMIVLFAGRTIARNADWKDALTLMDHDIEQLDRSAYAHHALGMNLMYVSTSNTKLSQPEALSMQQQAIDHFNRSIRIYPYFFNAHFDLSRVYIGRGDYVKAKDALLGAYATDSSNLFALEELAKTSFELKQADETEKYANLFIAKEPMNENVHEILAYLMLTSNRKADAKKYAERGLRYFPANKNMQMILKDAQK